VSVTPSARLWLAAAEAAEAAVEATAATATAGVPTTETADGAPSVPVADAMPVSARAVVKAALAARPISGAAETSGTAGAVSTTRGGGYVAGRAAAAAITPATGAASAAGVAGQTAAAQTARAASAHIVLMAGPGLDHAEPEIAALARRYPEAIVLTGAAATAAATADALDGAALAHIATHGRFRADHPLFSSLDAADGPLYVYDLERLGTAPQLLILSACESALSGVRPGDELMGLASAVFALGTRTLIASVTPVNDSDTRTLMLALHAELAAGLTPAAALAAASAGTGIGGFVCFGFGG
jgi:hypothetical protein